jgi:CRP-like cAMP-binding protein
MIQQKIQTLVQRYLRDEFGRLLQLRSLTPRRRAAGILWRADVVCPTPEGEIPVGHLGVDEDGRFVERLTVTDLLDALREYIHVEQGQGIPDESENPLADELSSFEMDLDLGFDSGDDDDLEMWLGETYDEIRQHVDDLLEPGTPEAIREGLQVLPRLLTFPETRGDTLAEMAELEARVGEGDLAINYLEAATREYADRSNLEGLEALAELALRLLGEGGYEYSLTKQLLSQLKERLAPVSDLFALDYFSSLDDWAREALVLAVRSLTLAPGEDLVREGAEAEHVYVISSGQVSVLLEGDDGVSRPIRCLFPGELVGEAAVLESGAQFRTATIRADRVSTVWELDGPALRSLIERVPDLAASIVRARDLRRVHSFFSMHETMGQLDVRVRDQLMGCIRRIARHPAGSVLCEAEQIPTTAVLVAQGKVHREVDGAVAREYPADTFAALRDSIMGLAADGRFVVAEDSTLVEFDSKQLRELCQASPPEVVAVMERLE